MEAQNEMDVYRNIFAYADTQTPESPKGEITNHALEVATQAAYDHPAGFFQAAAMLLKDGEFNNAGFVYYVGYFRYRYYNMANPDYEESNDGALFTSMRTMLGEPINLFLKTDIDNFIAILLLCQEYIANSDYAFFPRAVSPEDYDEQMVQIDRLIENFTTDREACIAEWTEGQQQYRDLINQN